jgi:TolB protein
MLRKIAIIAVLTGLALAARAWASGEGIIIFSSAKAGGWDLWSIRPDGTGLKRITSTPGAEHSPAVSPDGTEIAYIADRTVHIMRSDGNGDIRLPLPVGIYAQPDWMPSGEGVAFVRQTVMPTDATEIWVVEKGVEGWESSPKRIAKGAPMKLTPRYSPSGEQMAYVEFTRDNFLGAVEEIGIMDIKEGTFKLLTAHRADSLEPAWSPSGDRIAYASNRSGNYDLWVMKSDGTDQVRLTKSNAFDSEPAWSSDGTELAFISTRSGTKEIWVISSQGTDPRQVTKIGKGCKDPVWVEQLN